MRTVGVEEELLLVDARTGEVRSWADAVLREETDDRLTTELQQEQLETGTRPTAELAALHSDIVGLRRRASEAAAGFGCRGAGPDQGLAAGAAGSEREFAVLAGLGHRLCELSLASPEPMALGWAATPLR